MAHQERWITDRLSLWKAGMHLENIDAANGKNTLPFCLSGLPSGEGNLRQNPLLLHLECEFLLLS